MLKSEHEDLLDNYILYCNKVDSLAEFTGHKRYISLKLFLLISYMYPK